MDIFQEYPMGACKIHLDLQQPPSKKSNTASETPSSHSHSNFPQPPKGQPSLLRINPTHHPHHHQEAADYSKITTTSISSYNYDVECVKLLNKVSNKAPGFSTVGGERSSPDTARDPHCLSVKIKNKEASFPTGMHLLRAWKTPHARCLT
ncbi:hypothetical protein PtB15_2B157 [Puccinia triticina]|nr:hypothetical protein PtB15_2B157 [Puccinia triticina]